MTTPTETMDVETSAPDDGDRLAAAMEAASAIDDTSETPEAPPESPPPVDEQPADDLRAIAERAAARRAEREAAERQQHQQTETERIATMRRAEADALLELARKDPLAFLDKMGHDPVKHYEELTRRQLKGDAAKSEDEIASLKAQIAALEAKLDDDVESRAKAQQSYMQQQEEQRFIADVRTDAFPLLAAYEDEVLLSEGYKLARLYQEAAEPYDNARIARVLNARLAERLGSLAPKIGGNGAAVTPQVNGDRSGTANGAAPRTITAGMASQSATPQDDDSDEARMRRAVRVAEQQGL